MAKKDKYLTLTLLEPKVIFHIRAVLPGSILLADKLQLLILITLKLTWTVPKIEVGLDDLRNSAG